jgi:protein-S-isoprenylcysteine O-methyltransferase Ste14
MENEILFRVALLVMAIGYIAPRFYYRSQARRADPQSQAILHGTTESRVRLALMGISGLGTHLLSILWLIHPAWLDWSSLTLPNWLRWIGAAVAAVTVWLGYLVHRDLGISYTPTLKTGEKHQLVVQGVYRWMRHPMYTSFFAYFIASFLLIANWLVGVLGLIYSLLILERVGHEERMLLDMYGEGYRHYMRRTGRFLPRRIRRNKGERVE